MSADAVAQLRSELGARAHALAVAIGLDPVHTERMATRRAEHLVDWLAGGDDQVAAGACVDVMAALWPDPCDPPPEWWSTPLGRLCARSAGTDDAEAVTHSVAAAMLGVHIGTIKQWVHRGQLDRHPDGGVLRSSIMARLARA